MDSIASLPSGLTSDAAGAKDIVLLKKAQELMEQQHLALLEALPPAPSPPGVGGQLDLMA